MMRHASHLVRHRTSSELSFGIFATAHGFKRPGIRRARGEAEGLVPARADWTSRRRRARDGSRALETERLKPLIRVVPAVVRGRLTVRCRGWIGATLRRGARRGERRVLVRKM